MKLSSQQTYFVQTMENDRLSDPQPDAVAVEEPLEIRLSAGEAKQTVAVTMRTPGHDRELAAGFLFCEGVIRQPGEVQGVYQFDDDGPCRATANQVIVKLNGQLPDISQLERHFFTSSACGVCGKTSLTDVAQRSSAVIRDDLIVSPDLLRQLPQKLRAAQTIFDQTGGLHAAALFDQTGELTAVFEDVGRHNALDKLIGWGWLNGQLPFQRHIVLVSGRASFELLEKAVMAGVQIVCSVSAPSSLAIETADRFGLTLVGFLRRERFNVYTGMRRLG